MSDANFPDWRNRFAVQFRQGDRTEEGIGQGVNTEFLEDLLTTGFDPNRGLFMVNQNGDLYPNPAAATLYPDTYRSHYRFLGKILGRLIFQRSLVRLPLASFFLSKLLRGNTGVDLSELQSLDPEIYRNLMYIKNHPDQARSLMLDFTTTLSGALDGTTVELVPNGENIPVTEENYSEYIIRMADYYLNRSIRSHCAAFRDGFTSIVDPAWIKLFNQRELDVIIQGVQTEIDIDDLEENTNYSSVTDPFQVPSQQQSAEQQQSFGADHPTIVNFWKVLRKFTHAERTKFLRFVTSKSRAPLRGFKDLEPKFTILKAVSGTDYLPSASTCVNLLKMPPYETIETLEMKLREAIETNTFENT
jgi:ubiquitin-protein ligase E3 C